MTGPRHPTARALKLTDAQTKMVQLLGEAYVADVAVEIGTKTRKAFEADKATVSRTVARGIVTLDLAYYSPAGTYLLLSDRGKELCGIPVRPRVPQHRSMLGEILRERPLVDRRP